MSPPASSLPHPPLSEFPLGKRELVVMLALSQALQALAIDSMLPGLAAMSADLELTDPNRRQLVVGLFMLGIGLGALIPGALADRFGRRPVLITCIAGYFVTSLACAVVTDFTWMLVFRMAGGLICGGLSVVPSAVIRDRFEGDRMASLQSMITVIFLVVPMIAPSIGQGILLFAGWRWIFGFMALLGGGMGLWVFLRLPETLRPEYRQAMRVAVIGQNMRQTLTTRASIGYVIAMAFTTGVMWGYVQSSQQLVGEHFGAGRTFPLFFGGMALCMACASFTNARIVERFGARRVAHTALFAYGAAALAQYGLAHGGHETLWQFAVVQTLAMICGGFMGANFASIALQPFARIAGSAASVQAFIRNSLAGVIGAVIGQAYDGTARPFSTALVVTTFVALALILWSEEGKLFRRLHPRGAQRIIA